MKKFLQSWLINTLAVLVAAHLLNGIHYKKPLDLIVASLLLGICNAVLRPILVVLTLPLLLITLGLFLLVINAALLYFIGSLHFGFYVDDFSSAFWGALIISLITIILNSLTGTGDSRVKIQKGPPPSRREPPGNGPVIDV